MTAGDDSLFVTVGGRDIGLADLLNRVDAEMQQSAQSAVRLGQQYARLAQAQGQPALASQVLAGTMQRAGAAGERSLIGLATQQARLENSSQGLTATLAGLSGQLGQLGGAAGQLGGQLGALAGGLGSVGWVGAALGIVKIGVDAGIAGAQVQLLDDRFDSLAESAGTTGDALLGALRSASGGEINDFNLQLAANKAQLLGVADSAQEFSTLMAIARDRAQQLGITTTQAFNDLVTGLGRGSALILDNLGIIVSVEEANKSYAASIGKTVAALSEQEKKQALINQVLQQGQATLAATGGAVEGNANAFARAGVTLQNTTSAFSTFLANGLAPYAASIGDAGEKTAAFIAWLQGLGTTTAEEAAQAAAATAATNAYAAAIEQGGSVAQANTAYEAAYATALQQSAAQTGPAATAFDAYRTAALAAGAANDQARAQIAAATGELQTNAQAAVLAAGQQQAQTAATAALTAETNAAVNAFLALNPNLDAAGIASAIAAGKVPPLVGQLAALRLEANQTSAALAQLAAQQAGVRGLSQLFATGVAGRQTGATGGVGGRLGGGASAALAQNDALRQSERDLALARAGSAAEQIRLLQAQADKTLDVVERNRLLIRIEGLRGRGAGGGGGGASVKLTDQQKLESQLLSSQEQFALKSEDAERAHLDRLLDIQADFRTRMLDAQDNFAQSQLEGRAGFYDSLGSIEDAGLRQSLAQQYEAAFQEADQIARTRGADVGEAFLEAKQAALEAQAQRQSEIAQATEEGDKGRAEYLAGVDRLYREAEDRKLARIAEGRDSLAAQQQEQLADEESKYLEGQEKLGTAAERSADRAITAADRRGQAIDVEALKVGGLADQYARIGGAQGTAIGPGSATSPLTTPQATTPAAAAAAEGPLDIGTALASIASKLDELRGALVAAEQRGADQVAGAVRNLRGVVS